MDVRRYPRWDILNSVPLCHLSYILNKFIPLWYIKTLYKYIYEGSLETFKYSRRTRLPPEHYANLVFAGSLGDCLVVPDSDPRGWHPEQESFSDHAVIDEREKNRRIYDIDIVYLRTDIVAGYEENEAPYIMDTLSTRPGYFRLHRRGMEEFVKSSFLTGTLSQKMENLGIGYSATGPALTVQLSAWEEDHVSTGCCQAWPHEAERWMTRVCPSGWPDKLMRENIASKGCHFVAKPHKLSIQPELEFRFSLVVATKTLIDNITPKQRQCYIIFKTLVKHNVKQIAFTTYCLKTIFLYTLEKIPLNQWEDTPTGLASCLLCLIDDLLHGLIDNNIPHYFMPDCNLLENVCGNDLKNNMKQICELRRNILGSVLDYDDLHALRGLLYFPLSDVFKALVDEAHNPKQTFKQCLEMYAGLDFRYFTECLNGHMIYGVLNIIPEIEWRGSILEPPEAILIQTEFMQEYASSSILKDDFGERKSGEMMGFLASLCSMLFLVQPEKAKTDLRKLSVDNGFKTAFSHQQLYGANFIYYGFFLISCGKMEDAISVLKKTLNVDRNKDMIVFEYFFMMKDHLDNILKHLLYTRVYLCAPAHILAYYLLIQLYIKTNRTDAAEDLLADFSTDCDRCYSNYGVVHCHLLLAWSCMCLGRYWQAGDAFKKDRTLSASPRKDNIVKMWICRAMALYSIVKQKM